LQFDFTTKPGGLLPLRSLFCLHPANQHGRTVFVNRLLLLMSALAAATALAQPASPEQPAVSSAAPARPALHVVQPGDSLIKIGRQYGVRVEDLRKANNLTGDLIIVGHKLVIPAPTAATVATPSPPATATSQLAAENQQLRQQLNEANARLADALAKALESETNLTQAQDRLAAAEVQVKTAAAEKDTLQQKLAESEKRAETLAATVAVHTNNAAKMRELEQQLATLAKASELQPALTQAQSRLAAAEAQIKAVSAEKATLQQRLVESGKRAENLEATIATQTKEARNVRELEQQLAALQEKLTEANRQLAGRNVQELERRMATLNEAMLAMRARLKVYETKAAPYTPEELALFHAPAVTNLIAADSLEREQVSPAAAQPEARTEQNPVASEPPKAEKTSLQTAQPDDREIRTLCNLAITQAAQERYAEAEQTIRKALALRPNDAASLAVLGHALRAQKRNEEALDVLSRAASCKPDDAGIQTLLGITLAEKGLRGQAETAFRKALQINPNHVDAHRNLATLYLTQPQPPIELARWHYRQCRAAGAPASPELEKRLAAAAQNATSQ